MMKLQSIGIAIAIGIVFTMDLVTLPGIDATLTRPAYANEPIPTKPQWKTVKERLGIPSNLGRGFDMGDEFQRYHNIYPTAQTQNQKLQILVRLDTNLTSYLNAVKNLNPPKPTAVQYLTDVLATVKAQTTEVQARPIRDFPERLMTVGGYPLPITAKEVQAIISAKRPNNNILWIKAYQSVEDFADDWTLDRFRNPGHLFSEPEGKLAEINFAPFNATPTTIEGITAHSSLKPYYIKFRDYFADVENYWYNAPSSGSTLYVAVVRSSLMNVQGREEGMKPRIVMVFTSNQPTAQVWQAWLEPIRN